MFPPLSTKCLCRCVHVSGVAAVFSLFFSFLCLMGGFFPAIANPKQPFFPWLALRLCLSRFPLCSFSHYKAVFFGEHLLFSPVSSYLSCFPHPHPPTFLPVSLFFLTTQERIYSCCCAFDRKKPISPPPRYFFYYGHNNHNWGTGWQIFISLERMERRKESIKDGQEARQIRLFLDLLSDWDGGSDFQ